MNAQNPKHNWLIWLMAFCLVATVALADTGTPVPPNDGFTVVSSSKRIDGDSVGVQAIAGNVSELMINSSFVTNGWQGYYGNISGTIVLDDALNNTMYSWELADPEGEIYASRDNSLDWGIGNIICADITNIETEESTLKFNLDLGQDADGINETFKFTTHPPFIVASNVFDANDCGFTASTYVDDTADPNRAFNETILYSTSDVSMIYTALIIRGGNEGFKLGGDNYDFQMLVPEDGHQGDLIPTDYFFWVEIQ